jgi:nucleoside-diphosphate-sugar epimerase
MKLDALEQSQHLNKASRVVVTGASGWLGRTMVHILESQEANYLLLGSSSRIENFSIGRRKIHKFTEDLVREFSPTLVTDFAFLTRETIGRFSLSQYIEMNRRLIEQAKWMMGLPSIRGFVSTSSGAAVFSEQKVPSDFEDNPYGYLKRESEYLLMSFADRIGVPHVVARPWSVTGEFVTKVQGFAFSQMIHSAITLREIEIKSNRPVYRRYVDVEDLLRVCLGILESVTTSRVIDSGGELVDLVALGRMIGRFVGTDVHVRYSIDESLEADAYFSTGISWSEACNEIHFGALGLEAQIAKVTKSLVADRNPKGI